MSYEIQKAELFAALPKCDTDSGIKEKILAAVDASGRKVVVLDDDPTGSQTVHDIQVLTTWDVDVLATALNGSDNVFYILTNSRSLDAEQAADLNREIATNLCAASKETGVGFDVISRSDSTLRGHYPLELDVLEEVLATELEMTFDGHLLIPAFFEGGRFTVNDVHYVQYGDSLVPAAETEFAQDAVFGYRHSNMAEYVEEKTAGQCPARDVIGIGIDDLRKGGARRVTEILMKAGSARRIFVNAAEYTDLEVFVLGLLEAEKAGKRYLVRSSASFVKVRGGISSKPYLEASEVAPDKGRENGGLVVVGSYVGKTSAQIEEARKIKKLNSLEIDVNRLLEENERSSEISRVRKAIEENIGHGIDTMIYTSRKLVKSKDSRVNLDIGQKVSSALVEIVKKLDIQPRFLIAKGGITSSDLATDALGVRSALVIGQVAPGISAWRLMDETKFPGMAYIVFPGNVGTDETLGQVIRLLSGDISDPA